MTTLWMILAACGLGFPLVTLLDRRRRWPAELELFRAAGASGDADAESSEPRDVVVVIPARDEEDLVEECLSSLLDQRESFARLVYVDDRSTDGTARRAEEVIAARGAEDVARVVRAAEPPGGWSGKMWALRSGVADELSAVESRGDDASRAPHAWWLFTDADIRHPPGSIRALRRLADAGARDLVSVMVRLRTRTFWERLLIPPFVFFFQWIYPFRRVGDPRSRVAAAAGGCVLLSRAALERAGGIDAIRGAVIDDVTLAGRVKGSGGSTWLGVCPRMESARGYDTLRGIVRMVARTAYTQLAESAVFAAAAVVALLLFIVAPPAVALGAGLLALGGGAETTAAYGSAAAMALLSWAGQAWVFAPVVRHQGVPRSALWAWTLPFAMVLYAWMVVVSTWRGATRRGNPWKGRPDGVST